MFNKHKKKIEQLEAQLADIDRKIARLEDEITQYDIKFEYIGKMLASKPDYCNTGIYCKACAFAKEYRIYSRLKRDYETLYLCNKAGSCQEFVQKEEE